MNLCHWDDVVFFSREEIAFLLAGVDPNGGPYATATEKRIKHYRKLVAAGIDGALKHAQIFVNEITERPEVIAPDIFEYDAWGCELPSYELRCSVANHLYDPANSSILLPGDPGYLERFNRDDVHYWAIGKGLTKGYCFDGSANESIRESIMQQPSVQDSDSDQLEFAFETQLEALLQRYWGFADNLIADRDVAHLNRIGSWQRITMLDRMEDGEEFLTDLDAELLARVGATGAAGYVLDDDQANREWRAASYPEKWIAFGVHVYCRIIAGEASTDEAFFLFRLASEMVGFLERGDPEQSREEFLAQHARAAANARHSKPGGSRDKRLQIREIWSSGKYSSRDICAEQECAALGMSFSSARKALRGTPNPS
jgi:hypothetical protein